MSGKIFINYRRGDDPGTTGRLFDQLEDVFPREQLFIDVDSIPPGRDFVRVLEEQVAQCDVLLAVIGTNWIDARDDHGVRRLDNPDDFVRIEIESALKQDKLVIPVLVRNARMPSADELPEAIRPLARRNAVRLTHERFKSDAQALIKGIQQALNEASAQRHAREEAVRKAAVEEERRREEEAARQRAPADARAAQEKVEAATLEASERQRRETEAWVAASGAGNVAALEAFLEKWPQSQHAKVARARIRELKGTPTRRRLLQGVGGAAGLAAIGGGAIWVVQSPRSTGSQSPPQVRANPLIRALTGHSAGVSSVVFSPDGQTALSGSDDKTLKLWDLATGKEVRTFTGNPNGVFAVAFSPDGGAALSGNKEEKLRLWEVSTGRLLRTFSGHSDGILAVAFSRDGRLALSGSSDTTLKVWEVATGKNLRTMAPQSRGRVSSIATLPDSRSVLTGNHGGTLTLWELATGKELRTFTRHSSWVTSVAVSADGRVALSGSSDKTLKVWDVVTGNELRTIMAHSKEVYSVALAPDGRTALSGGADAALKLWEVTTGRNLYTFQDYAASVWSVAFSPDGRTALSGRSDGIIEVWDMTRL